MTKVAIVILNWNGCKMLEQFLPSVLRYSCEEGVEVYVADNASADSSVEMLKNNFPRVKLVLLKENYGYAEGYNQALKQIEATYYILLNSDVEVTEGWLRPLIQHMEMSPEIAACQPKIRSWRNKDYFEYAGACGGFIDRYGYPFCRGRIMNIAEKDENQYEDIVKVFWASGAAMMVRSADYWALEGLDGSFFAHMEEIDLCWRLQNCGKEIVCIPQSIVFHVGAATLKKENPRKTFLNFRNNLLMLYKNLPEEERGKLLFVRGFLDYLAALFFILKGELSNAKAVFQARKAYHTMIKEWDENERKDFIRKPTVKLTGWFQESILIQFYSKGKKYYSQLIK